MHRETGNIWPKAKGFMILKLAAVLSICSFANAGTLFERDLPTAGLNLSGASRSNIAPIQGSFVLGDDFTLSSSSVVDSITVWIVGNCPVTTCTPTNTTPNSEFSSISLFGGLDNGTNGPVTLISSSYTSTHVQYAGGVDYLDAGGSGLSYPIFQITFSGLSLFIPGGQLYDFAVSGTPNSTNNFALHASTASISGGIQQGADNLVLDYQGNPLFVAGVSGAGNFANFTNGADINVVVTGTLVPEPGVIGTCSLGLGILALAYRRRRS